MLNQTRDLRAGIGIQNAATERMPGTLERTQEALKRLYQLRDSLEIINRNLHGPRPEDSAKENAPSPNSLSNYVDGIHDQLQACESEVREIYKSLGIS